MTPSRKRQIEEMRQAVLKLRTADRTAFLDSSDPDLRQEVEALLKQESATEDATLAMIGVGARVGPYNIEAAIGKGGMGEMCRSVDTRLGRKVAIKASREEFDVRFEREARTIPSLSHPHICTL